MLSYSSALMKKDHPALTFAVDLLWVRPGKVGGTESMIRNLLAGMQKLPDDFLAVLIVSRDNADTFASYPEKDSRFLLITADVRSENIGKRIIWQNLYLNRLLRKNGLEYCFSPVYDRPLLNGGIKYVSTIHDIQAYHYPQYHPAYEVYYSKLIWMADRINSVYTICISQYVMDDLEKMYHFRKDKMQVIYNPVSITLLPPEEDERIFSDIKNQWNIADRDYYYTVGQLIPHKNIETLLKVMAKIHDGKKKEDGKRLLSKKLLISGIKGNAADEIDIMIGQLHLEENVILTGFVSDEERNSLYTHAKAFLFPSVFEGFGIPPIEAMMCGTPVITTRCTCIPEVTQELADYVEDPYDEDEWIHVMQNFSNRSSELDTSCYQDDVIAGQYLSALKKAFLS